MRAEKDFKANRRASKGRGGAHHSREKTRTLSGGFQVRTLSPPRVLGALNTLYMERVLDALAQERGCIDEADIALLSPARSAHLNPYGKFYFDVEWEFRRKGFRPLR